MKTSFSFLNANQGPTFSWQAGASQFCGVILWVAAGWWESATHLLIVQVSRTKRLGCKQDEFLLFKYIYTKMNMITCLIKLLKLWFLQQLLFDLHTVKSGSEVLHISEISLKKEQFASLCHKPFICLLHRSKYILRCLPRHSRAWEKTSVQT